MKRTLIVLAALVVVLVSVDTWESYGENQLAASGGSVNCAGRKHWIFPRCEALSQCRWDSAGRTCVNRDGVVGGNANSNAQCNGLLRWRAPKCSSNSNCTWDTGARKCVAKSDQHEEEEVRASGVDIKANGSDSRIRVRARTDASAAAFRLTWQAPSGAACLGAYDDSRGSSAETTITVNRQNSGTLPPVIERSHKFWQGVINPQIGVHTFYISCELPNGGKISDSVSVEGY